MKKRKCKGCGIEFEPKYWNQLFHDYFCHKKYINKYNAERYHLLKNKKVKIVICKYCGKSFETKADKHYCSSECLSKSKCSKKSSSWHKIDGFLIKILNNNGKFEWNAYKNNKLLLKSAENFDTSESCLKDAKSAFRG